MNKDQFVRYKTLDECFRNVNGTFTIDDLIEECDKALKAYHPGKEQVHVSRQTIEKDLSDLQARYGLVFQKGLTLGHKKIYRYEDTSYSLKKDRIEKLLDADALAIKQRSDERCVAEEAEVQEKRRRIKEHRTLINSEEYLNRVFGTDRQVFDIKFGQVIVSFEKKMIRFYEHYYNFSQILEYYEEEYSGSRPTGQYESTQVPVQVISSKPNTASVIGRAAIGSQIGGFLGSYGRSNVCSSRIYGDNRLQYQLQSYLSGIL